MSKGGYYSMSKKSPKSIRKTKKMYKMKTPKMKIPKMKNTRKSNKKFNKYL
jgi:hypothetical protein